jgi:hypothetical protein
MTRLLMTIMPIVVFLEIRVEAELGPNDTLLQFSTGMAITVLILTLWRNDF